MKKIKVALLIFACCSVFSGCGSSGSSVPAATPDPIQTPVAQVETPAPSEAKDERSDDEKIEEFMKSCELVLSQNFEDHFRVERYNFIFTIDVWQDGISDGVTYAKAGDQSCVAGWESMKEGMKAMSDGIINLKNQCGLENYHITLSVIDENNIDYEDANDAVLLSYFDGRILVDAVNDPE